MQEPFEQAGQFGKEYLDGSLRSLATLSNGMQGIATEAADYSKAAFEKGSKALERMMTAKSPEKAMQVQAEYAKGAYEEFVAQSAQMGRLYADMAKEMYKPLEAVVVKVK
jgi:hypothetical protein